MTRGHERPDVGSRRAARCVLKDTEGDIRLACAQEWTDLSGRTRSVPATAHLLYVDATCCIERGTKWVSIHTAKERREAGANT